MKTPRGATPCIRNTAAPARAGFAEAPMAFSGEFPASKKETVMPDGSIAFRKDFSQSMPSAATGSPKRLQGIERRIVSVIRPFLVRCESGDYECKEGWYKVEAYRALMPIFGTFTVADAAKAFSVVCAAMQRASETGEQLKFSAFYEAHAILNAFLAAARPTTPQCVSALAQHLTVYVDNEPVMFDTLEKLAAMTLRDGVEALCRQDFSGGELFAAAGDGLDPNGWCYRAAMAGAALDRWYGPSIGETLHCSGSRSSVERKSTPEIGQVPAPSASSAGRAFFDPAPLFEEMIDAVLPLMSSKGEFLEGKSDCDVLAALKPVIGDLTVEEAVYLYAILGIAELTLDHDDSDDPRWNALLRARWMLQNFVSNAYISTPRCATARAWLAEFHIWENERAGMDDRVMQDIVRMTQWDVRDLRRGVFHGDMFFNDGWNTAEPRWFSIMNLNREA